jgi:hypothetical protein
LFIRVARIPYKPSTYCKWSSFVYGLSNLGPFILSKNDCGHWHCLGHCLGHRLRIDLGVGLGLGLDQTGQDLQVLESSLQTERSPTFMAQLIILTCSLPQSDSNGQAVTQISTLSQYPSQRNQEATLGRVPNDPSRPSTPIPKHSDSQATQRRHTPKPRRFVDTVLKRFQMETCNGVAMPIGSGIQLQHAQDSDERVKQDSANQG